MRTVGSFEAKNTFGSLLNLVESGEEVTITRHGKPVARMVAPIVSRDREAARQAAERIRLRSKTMTLDGLSIRDLIDDGRK
jgi:prevent-host-death family protein